MQVNGGNVRGKSHQTLRHLPVNSRFYIVATAVLMSGMVFCYLRSTIASDQLVYIRAEQVFGFIALVYWYCALIISPLKKVYGDSRLMRLLEFSRRAIGVSAAYFALLHAATAIWGQMGGLGHLTLLPNIFRWSVALGCGGLAVLTVMAATSFDKVIRFLTFPRWKQIHRLGYGAGVVTILHVWLIGTHVGQFDVRAIAFGMLAILFSLEATRIARLLAQKHKSLRAGVSMIALVLWLIFISALLVLPQAVSNYHNDNHIHGGTDNANR